jgi:tetratricopeptide (TPR) repeat protein/DNA-binding CsgD family transcriptional regulator
MFTKLTNFYTFEVNKDPLRLMRLSFILLFILLQQFNFAQTDAKSEKLLKELASAKDTTKINILNKLAEKVVHSQPSQSLLYASEALTLSKSLNYKKGEANAEHNLAIIEWISGNLEQALSHLQNALQAYSEINDIIDIGAIQNIFGLIYCRKGDYKLSELNYRKALAIYENLKDTNRIAAVLGNIGIVYTEKADYTKALEYCLEAIKLNENNSSLTTSIGIIYGEQGNHEKSLAYYKKSQEICLSMSDKNDIANAYSNIGVAYYNLHNLDSAETNYLYALNNYKEVGNKNGLSQIYYNLGVLYLDKGRTNDALAQYQKALLIQKDVGNKEGESTTLLDIANLYKNSKNYSNAIEYYNQALSIANEIGLKRNCYKACNELSGIYANLNEYAKAYKYYKEYVTIKDSIFNTESNNKLLTLETQYETEKKENKILLLNKEVQLKESKTKLLYAVIGSIVIISFLIILFQITKHQKNKKILQVKLERKELNKRILETEVQAKEKELELNKNTLLVYTQHLFEKNALLEDLNSKLKELESDQPEENEKLKQINQLASSRIITEEDWEQFKNLFENVYSGFFLRMRKEYPGITAAELRLAALIKLNISSRKIAAMIGISDDSVKKTRQRLRKKMQLDTEDGLEEVIHSM